MTPRRFASECEQSAPTSEQELAHLVHLVNNLRELVQEPRTSCDPGARPPRRRRVLVVEDARDAADTWASLLERAGCETVATCSGSEALDVAKQVRPEMVLLDIDLPSLSRYEIARLRAEETLKGSLLVAVTGWGAEGEQTCPNAAGFDFYLTKPPMTRQALDLLARLRDRRLPPYEEIR